MWFMYTKKAPLPQQIRMPYPLREKKQSQSFDVRDLDASCII